MTQQEETNNPKTMLFPYFLNVSFCNKIIYTEINCTTSTPWQCKIFTLASFLSFTDYSDSPVTNTTSFFTSALFLEFRN